MVSAMAAFAVEDVFVKAASKTLPVGQVLFLFGLGGAFVFACVAIGQKQRLFTLGAFSSLMRLRMLFETFGRLFYVLAIALAPLSAATVILQATPIVVVAGATLIFGEKVGWQRWFAVFIGLAGVVVIVRPGTDSFSLFSILAVLGMLGFAGRDLSSRAAPSTLSTSILGLYGFLSVVAAGVLYSIWDTAHFEWLAPQPTLYLSGAVIFGVVAYFGLMKAMRTGEVSTVTPFRFSRLIFGVGFGRLLFDEPLDGSMLAGCGLIVASGLFILWGSRRVVRVAGPPVLT
ncbi:MAG: DMT family transporter [Pirellulaceae bacterium]